MVNHYWYRFDYRWGRLEVGNHFAKYANGEQGKTKAPRSDAEKVDQANLTKKRNPYTFTGGQLWAARVRFSK